MDPSNQVPYEANGSGGTMSTFSFADLPAGWAPCAYLQDSVQVRRCKP